MKRLADKDATRQQMENFMITSMKNDRMKHAIRLRDKSRLRNEEGLFVAEGLKMFEEAPVAKLREVYCREDLWQSMETARRETFSGNTVSQEDTQEQNDKWLRLHDKLEQCRRSGVLVETVSEEVFRKLSDTQTPQGIFFLMEKMTYELPVLLEKAARRQEETGQKPLFLLLEDIQDPGNLGTMIRTGEGAGVSGILMSRGTVDIYNPKTIRSTMGSLYRVPFLYMEDPAQAVMQLKQSGVRVYAAHLKGTKSYREAGYEAGTAFLIGNEGNGLKEETAALADEYIRIPMQGKLESLNAAVAAALLMYEAGQKGGTD